MIDLILVDPPVTNEKRFGKLAKAGSFLPSLGLACLAAVTREAGFTVKIIDANLENFDLNDLVLAIFEAKPKWIGISATTLTINTVGKIAALIKKADRGVKVIVGGAHITAVPEETLKRYSRIDIGVIGEGEETLKELLEALDKEKDLEKVDGLILRYGKKLIKSAPRAFISNLDKLPLPAWDLLKGFPKKYKPSVNSYLKLPAAHLVTSRGCTGQCLFCDRSVFGRIPRMYSAKKVIEMIDYLVENYNIREIQFFDDNFCLFPKRLEEICQRLAKRKEKLSWSCQARADMVNPQILKFMKRAGCWQIGLGIESGSDKILKILKKQETRQILRQAIEDIAKEGIEVKGFFILGSPGETKESLSETENFIMSLPLTYVHTTYFTPYPGCEAYHTASKFGDFRFKDDWSKIGLGTIKAVFVPRGLSKRTLEKTARRIFNRFYFRPKIIYYHLRKILLTPHLWPGYLAGFSSVVFFAKNEK